MKVSALNEVELAWLRNEITKCIRENDFAVKDNRPGFVTNDDVIEAEGRIEGLQYVEYLLDIAMFDRGTHGRAEGPRYQQEIEDRVKKGMINGYVGKDYVVRDS